MNAVASVLAVSVSVVCDQVDQVVPAHQVDDIDEVHELDPVHQVDHKDECSKISLQKRHHKMDQPGFKKTCSRLVLKSPGDILRGMILNRLSFWRGSPSILRSFLVDLSRHLEMVRNKEKM